MEVTEDITRYLIRNRNVCCRCSANYNFHSPPFCERASYDSTEARSFGARGVVCNTKHGRIIGYGRYPFIRFNMELRTSKSSFGSACLRFSSPYLPPASHTRHGTPGGIKHAEEQYGCIAGAAKSSRRYITLRPPDTSCLEVYLILTICKEPGKSRQ